MISNEQIAHDLAVAAVADGWRSEEVPLDSRTVVKYYEQQYQSFLRSLNN